MRRLIVLFGVVAMLGMAGCSADRAGTSAPEPTSVRPLASAHGAGLADSPWPMFRHDAQHTGRSQYAGPQSKPHVRWSYRTSAPIEGPAAVGTDGAVYVGDGPRLYSVGFDGEIILGGRAYSLTPKGALRWSAAAPNSVCMSPVIASDGTIYFAAVDRVVRAVRSDGKPKWARSVGVWSSPSLDASGTIYAAAARPQDHLGGLANYLTMLSVSDGSAREATLAFVPFSGLRGVGMNDLHSSPAIGPDGTVYLVAMDKRLRAIAPSGAETWADWTGGQGCSPAIGADGTIYVGGDRLYAVNPDGSVRWTVAGKGFGGERPDYVGKSPAIGPDGTVYMVGSDALIAVSTSGTVKWSAKTEEAFDPVVDARGTVYVANTAFENGWIDAYNPDGSKRWKFKLRQRITSPPVIGKDGVLYLGVAASGDGRLLAIGD